MCKANVLRGLAKTERRLGREDAAYAAFREARDLYAQAGNRKGEALAASALAKSESRPLPEARLVEAGEAADLAAPARVSDARDPRAPLP
jgi:hypothetical protein